MLTGVILAGGNKENLDGSPTSTVTIGSQSIIEIQIRIMKTFCSEILIVTDKPRTFVSFVPRDIRIITDYYKNKGPLGGLHAALTLAKEPLIWVVAYNMPFISVNVTASMLSFFDHNTYQAIIPVLSHKQHFYHSLYRKEMLPHIEAILNSDKKTPHPSHLLDRISWAQADKAFFKKNNLNTHCLRKFTCPSLLHN